jgi:hypothetical protein
MNAVKRTNHGETKWVRAMERRVITPAKAKTARSRFMAGLRGKKGRNGKREARVDPYFRRSMPSAFRMYFS